MNQNDAHRDKAVRWRVPERIRTKLVFYFIAVNVVILIITALAVNLGLPFVPLGGRLDSERQRVVEHLDLIADLKKERLLRWVEDRRDDTTVLASSPTVSRDLSVIHADVCTAVADSFDILHTIVKDNPAYQSLVSQMDVVVSAYGVYNGIMIADVNTGTVVVSTDSTDIGSNISHLPYFKEVFNSLHTVIGNIVFDAKRQTPMMHFAHLVVDEHGAAIGVLVIRVLIDDIITPMLHSGVGLGKSGETLLVNHQRKIITSLKYPLPTGRIAKLLEYAIVAEPAFLAAIGEEGVIESDDYRGVPVLAAYRHIHIASGWGWGMVVKMDLEELYAPLWRGLYRQFIVGLLALLISILIAFELSRRITKPLTALSEAARKVTAGDMDSRAPVTADDEVGHLANSFNFMVNRLQDMQTELEERVRVRTEELSSVVDNLEAEKISRQRVAQDLVRSNMDLEQFAYVASHDLREPLRMVTSYTQLLARRYQGTLDEEADEFIAFAVDGAERMQILIDDLLEYSRIGGRDVSVESVDCNRILDNVLGDLKSTIDDNKALITFGLLPTIIGDGPQLERLFQNLIANSIKFRNDEVPKVEIAAELKDAEWHFTVSDNGIGIKEEHLSRIFVIFQRLHDRDSHPGTGIGLAISKRIVENHGGTIWATSVPGSGTSIHFTIPLDRKRIRRPVNTGIA
jgi:signal transduction histidine kinase